MRRLIRFRAIDRHIFEDIKKRKKTVETRAASERYQKIKVGDVLIFRCGSDSFEKKVRKVTHFKSAEALFKKHSFKDVRPDLTTKAEAIKAYGSFPGYIEKIRKFGIVAFEL